MCLPQWRDPKTWDQSRPMQLSLLLKWTDILVFLVSWVYYRINFELSWKNLASRTGKKPSQTLLELCSLQGSAFGQKDRRWPPVSGRSYPKTCKGKKHRKRRKQTVEDDIEASRCKNPFHFLKRFRNLSNKRRTKCPCSKETASRNDIPNSIRMFIPQLAMETVSETMLITSQADQIRAQHDRGKKRKSSILAKSKQRKKQNKN